ncbi:PHP domain-containing protein [Leisingera sp. ANG-Vp]|uniref:PHP domain-containing protein n=1 Tax=Leisingera sp. ANG-Vp TaxID=1577896 RepID=UPI00057FE841|nr:PHP domain-containing protein [Leisingera sp. ANG-Vp]KIC19823.1 phosphotransferase [Leisingera sp. ANG-Vp]
MLHPAFATPGEFYRGNLHTHSNRSDGVLDPSEVCRRYKAEGYDFIALTDHFVGLYDYPVTDTAEFRDEVFTTLLGAEVHSGAMENGELWHLVAVGLPTDFAPSHSPGFHPVDGQESGPELAQRARNAGAFVAVAHPHWSGLTLADARSIEAAHAVEIYNHGCAVECDRGEGFHVADLLLSEHRDLTLIATDDAHFASPDHFGGWVMVKAEANEPGLLLEALKAGHFYSSQGPELKAVALNNGYIDVACSAVSTVIVQGHGSAALSQHGESLTQARIPLERFSNSPWLRVTVIDRAGKRAWSNPVWR